jgi:hypothetical protein
MASVKHPYTNDKPRLVEDYNHGGIWTFSVERIAKYRRAGGAYHVREFFATVRPVYDNSGFLPHCTGVIVSRNDFGEVMHFDDFDTAKRHVQALFALEYAAG